MIGILHVDDDVIRHNVLHVLRTQTNLFDFAFKPTSRICVHREGNFVFLIDGSDVCLVNVGDDLHLRQVICNREKRGSRKTGRNRLAEGKLPACAEMCSTKALLAGDGNVIASIYKQRAATRKKGPEVWGWAMAYKEDANIAAQEVKS